jgi:hypothetical protein
VVAGTGKGAEPNLAILSLVGSLPFSSPLHPPFVYSMRRSTSPSLRDGKKWRSRRRNIDDTGLDQPNLFSLLIIALFHFSCLPSSTTTSPINMLSRDETLLTDYINLAVASSKSYPFFEGWTDAENRLHTRTGNVPFHELQNFLDSSQNYTVANQTARRPLFRVLSFSGFEGGRMKLFFSKEIFEQIKRSWNLHELTIEAFTDNNGIMSDFETKDTTCIVMKVAASRSIGIDGVSISHDRSSQITNVLYHRLQDEKGIFKALQDSPERCRQPAFFATVLYRCHQRRVEIYRQQVNEEITRIEHLTKFGGPGHLFDQRHKSNGFDQEIESDSAIKKLSYIQTELAVIGHVGRSSLELGQWLVDLVKKDRVDYRSRKQVAAQDISGLNQQSNNDLNENAMADNMTRSIDETEYVKRRATTVLSQLQTTKDRVDSQTNFVCQNPTHF